MYDYDVAIILQDAVKNPCGDEMEHDTSQGAQYDSYLR